MCEVLCEWVAQVGYGGYDFMKSGSGMITVFSLKNPSHPEFVFTTKSGVMTLDFHPQHPALLAVGLYDGTVAVYDVRAKNNQPLYSSTDPQSRHKDPVWGVKFEPEETGKNVNFNAVSSDGRVTNWIMNKNELVNEEIMELKLKVAQPKTDQSDLGSTAEHKQAAASSEGGGSAAAAGGDEEATGLAAGSTFSFNSTHNYLYVVGTEEGSVHKCSKSFSAGYLQDFEGHNMAVYNVEWNKFHPRVFLSCSADWTVKVWESSTARAMATFDLGSSVGDAAWAPFSSTCMAACTSDGRCIMFELNMNKYSPVCEYRVFVPKKMSRRSMAAETEKVEQAPVKCTKVSFNPHMPILLVGDDRGVITSLKLSPNLRKSTAAGWAKVDKTEQEAAMQKWLIHAGKAMVSQPGQ
jgi:dynein intermediate chain 1